MPKTRPRGAHLVGSFPLADNDEVFRLVGSTLSRHLRRVPDGETGERNKWARWQIPILEHTPGLEPTEPLHLGEGYDRVYPQVRRVPGTALRFGPLGYRDAAKASYDVFCARREEGVLPADCRFQVSLPTPFAVVSPYISGPDQAEVEPAYEARLLTEVEEMTAVVPSEDLAVQFDTAVEFAFLEGLAPSPFPDPLDAILERLARLGDGVPPAVELGFHLCYGDYNHKHFIEPNDTAKLVAVANGITQRVERSVAWIHLPVPRNRDDDAYFEPLAELSLDVETELYLGLVHRTDGVEGTNRRIEAAQRVTPEFGVATECGLGRRQPETIAELLGAHAEVADPIR